MTTAQPFYEPTPRVLYVRPKLASAVARSDDRVDWDEVQKTVEDDLGELAELVAQLRPGVRSRSGANRSPAVLLYVYRVFESVSDDEVDPIVVGVAFKPAPGGILVRGDACGEESGKIHFEHPECRKEVPESGRAVTKAASEIAARLAREVDAVLRALDEDEIEST